MVRHAAAELDLTAAVGLAAAELGGRCALEGQIQLGSGRVFFAACAQNLASSAKNLTKSAENLTELAGNLTSFAGNCTNFAGNFTNCAGNLTKSAGNLVRYGRGFSQFKLEIRPQEAEFRHFPRFLGGL